MEATLNLVQLKMPLNVIIGQRIELFNVRLSDAKTWTRQIRVAETPAGVRGRPLPFSTGQRPPKASQWAKKLEEIDRCP